MHTQGKEIYWNYREREPREAEAFAARLAAAGGYRAVKLTGSDAGYKDWFIDEFRRPGFTVEVGEGVNPLPLEDFEEMYKELEPILAEFIRG
ncbi:Gamma-D-glutamyl-L-diamino acid endopeptidase 1 [compost metagenome]